jgi:UDP-sugar transporter A1/2/3
LVPAVLYLIQNNLQYAAVSLLDAATFQVTYQLKILTTAIFSVILLQKKLTLLKWQSLVILTVGVALIQIPTDSKKTDESHDGLSRFAGLICVLFACILSGLAGVWFEKVLKGSKASLWVRNIQLCFFSIIPGLVFGVYVLDGEAVAEGGFFQGYNVWTWAAILCQAFGGLVVAVVVK